MTLQLARPLSFSTLLPGLILVVISTRKLIDHVDRSGPGCRRDDKISKCLSHKPRLLQEIAEKPAEKRAHGTDSEF